MLLNIITNPSLICPLEISFSSNSNSLSEKHLRGGCLKHGTACQTNNKLNPCGQSECCRHASAALLQSFHKKEAAVKHCA